MRLWPLLLPLAACQVLPGFHAAPPASQLTVYASHPGSTSSENQAELVGPLVGRLRTLPQLQHYESQAGDGFASFRLSFPGKLDIGQLKEKVRRRVDGATPALPGTLHRIFIWSDPGGPGVQQLPAGWDQVPPSQFEATTAALAGCSWSSSSLEALTRGLIQQGDTALRAAVLLAHDPSKDVTDILLARLEERATARERGLDAGDLVAAAALDGRGSEEGLLPLVIGTAPHPDLEVRVECARTLLRAGREEVVPFLLTVLRALTPAEEEHPPDWERVTTLMWAKSRAAKALTDRLGIPCRFRPDGSWAEQMAEADRLEELYLR